MNEAVTDRVRRLVLEVLAPTELGDMTPSQVDVWDGYENLVSVHLKGRSTLYWYELRKSTLAHDDKRLKSAIRTAYRNRGVVFPGPTRGSDQSDG